MANISRVGEGKVYLIAGGGKIYTDIAARFCRSSRSVEEIIASPYDKKIVQAILDSGHLAATEFDYFIFGVEGYSRVTEVQLVRKRIASYLISSGRVEKHGKRTFDVVLPNNPAFDKSTGTLKINDRRRFNTTVRYLVDGHLLDLEDIVPEDTYNKINEIRITLTTKDILEMIEDWYHTATVIQEVPEEEARYLKPQASAFKAIIGMSIHSLLDWFKIRMCNRSQKEIRDLATKMYGLCLKAAPDLFAEAGPSCKVLGFCPEMEQCAQMKGKILPLKEVKQAAREGRLHID